MDSSRIEFIERVFHDAMALTAEQRADFLAQACHDDEVRKEIASLLHASDEAPVYLDEPGFLTLGASTTASSDARRDGAPPNGAGRRVNPGDTIGPYRIVGKLGEGGFGIVYKAWQEEPLRRFVAIKIIKHGMGSSRVLARFELERQALALMDHPHIAKIFDAGTTPGGQPYFAMEVVDGVPITEYCDRNRVNVHRRLRLFQTVCSAVQHAHQKGIIHRDIKPSNILITEIAGAPLPVVIDFGIAKAIQHRITDNSLTTQMGEIVGTPAYMSPEQAVSNPSDFDTRSDVYSLGVVLYELLTGSTPDRPQLPGRHGDETALAGRPTKPSSTLLQRSTKSAAVAADRETNPRMLAEALRGDLDWIALKALAQDRRDRYQTASALAQDIEFHLASRPVSAGPPSPWYVLRCFARRHRGIVAMSALLAVLLVGFLLSMTGMYFRTQRAARKAEQFAAFMEETLGGVDASIALGRDTVMLKEMMDRAAERIVNGELSSVPEAEFRLRLTIGSVYRRMAEFERAEQMLVSALPLAEGMYGRHSLSVADALTELGHWLGDMGRADTALARYEEALAIRLRHHPRQHLSVANDLAHVAAARQSLGCAAEALPLFEEALAIRRELITGNHEDIAQGLGELAFCLEALGRADEALSRFRESLAMRRRLHTSDAPSIALDLNSVASCLDSLGRTEEALPLYEAALAMSQRMHPGDHPAVATCLNNVAYALVVLGRPTEALPRFERALALKRRMHNEPHPQVADGLSNLASCLSSVGREDEALPLYREALAMSQSLYEADHPILAINLNNVAHCLYSIGRPEEALPLFEASLNMRRRMADGDHPTLVRALHNMASCLYELDREEEALARFEETVALSRRVHGSDHPDVGMALNSMAACLLSIGDPTAALARYEEALEVYRRVLPEGHPWIEIANLGRGRCLLALEHVLAARKVLVGVWEAIADRTDVTDSQKVMTLEQIVETFEDRTVAPLESTSDESAELDHYVAVLAALRNPSQELLQEKAGSPESPREEAKE